MIRLGALFLSVLLVFFSVVGVQAGDAEVCDTLASDDAGRAPVVTLESIDADKAMAACAAAVAAEPANSALIHQYARALESAGRLDDALRLYQWAAADDYAPAVAALTRLSGVASAAPPWSAEEREKLSAELTALAGGLRHYVDALPSDPGDPLAVLAATGTDPDAILSWVAGNTRLVPYLGSLRGADGVLSDRAGNSLDRALALASLLTQAGQEVRLAHAVLSPVEAEALLAATGEPVAVPGLPSATREELVAHLADPRLPADLLALAATDEIDSRTRVAKLLAERTDALLPVLLAAAQPAEQSAEAEARTAALSALAEHYWVQVRSGTGWRDLDPDASVAGTKQPADTFDPKDLPEALRHAVTLRVVLELQGAEGRHEEVLLAHTVYPAEQGVESLTLSHLGKGLDALEQLVGSPDLPQRTLEMLDGVTAWTPVLIAGDTTIVDKLFTSEGAVRPGNLNAFAATGAGIGDLFSEAGSALDAEGPEAHETVVPTAEWLEVEVRVPGAEPRIERRTLFDLLGPAARASGLPVAITPDLLRQRALRLVGPTDVLVAGTVPSEVAVARQSATTVAQIAESLRTVAALPEPGISDVPAVQRVPLTLLKFAGQRLAGASTAALVAPNVFLMHERFGWDATAGVSNQIEFDIVFNDVGSVPFADRVRQGLIDTILENALLGDPRSGNAAALHAVDLAAGQDWSPLAAGDTERLAALGPDTRARIEADLGAGYIIVAPPGAGEAWWRIDPRSGTTLGMLSTGGGAELAENSLLVYNAVTSAACLVMVGAAMANAIGGPPGGMGGGQTAAGLIACAAATAGGAAAGATGAGIGAAIGSNVAAGGATGAMTVLLALAISSFK